MIYMEDFKYQVKFNQIKQISKLDKFPYSQKIFIIKQNLLITKLNASFNQYQNLNFQDKEFEHLIKVLNM